MLSTMVLPLPELKTRRVPKAVRKKKTQTNAKRKKKKRMSWLFSGLNLNFNEDEDDDNVEAGEIADTEFEADDVNDELEADESDIDLFSE